MAEGAEQSSEQGVVGQTRDFITGSIEELKKISRPTHQETLQFTLVTVLIICFISVCLMLLDIVFRQIMSALL